MTINKYADIVNEGVSFHKQENNLSAIKTYKKALSKVNYSIPKNLIGITHYYLGLSYFNINEYDNAIKSYKTALSYDNNDSWKYDLSLAYLHKGDNKKGMEYYKYRYYRDTYDSPKFPKIPMPFIEDDLSQLKGKKVLVLREQGIGDELMFSRVFDRLSQDVEFANIQVMDTLAELFVSSCSHLENLNIFTDMTLPYSVVDVFDCYTSLGNLFSMYCKDEFIPQNKLTPSPKDILTVDKTKFNIGICLGGNKASGNYHKRNIDPQVFKEFIFDKYKDKDIVLYNLQISEDVDYSINIKDKVSSMNDTANLITQMDAIYSTDTAMLYLSMLLGVDVTMLYRDFIWWVWRNDKLFKNVNKVKF
jgi:tetratricopeptide (TPR) repeat protein